MEVRREGGEELIPFVVSLCTVDLTARTIVMEIPPGLLGL